MNRIFVIFALLLAFVAQVHAQKEQSFMLTGTVFDEFNEPVPGANVYVKDKPGVGITTNIDGKFRLKVNIYDIVVVSFLGYENYEQRLTNKIDNVKVTLKPATENIDSSCSRYGYAAKGQCCWCNYNDGSSATRGSCYKYS